MYILFNPSASQAGATPELIQNLVSSITNQLGVRLGGPPSMMTSESGGAAANPPSSSSNNNNSEASSSSNSSSIGASNRNAIHNVQAAGNR